MPLATLAKTWISGVLNAAVGVTSAKDMSDGALLEVKNALKALSSNPWTVQASSDATVAAHDGVDRWLGGGNLNRKTFLAGGDPFSWIVLRQSGIASNFEIYIGFENSALVDNLAQELVVRCSPAAGFGAANGGTDGTTTSRPTATDEGLIFTGEWLGGTAFGDVNVSVLGSDDGECARAIVSLDSTATPIACLLFEAARLPPTDKAGAVVCSVRPTADGGSSSCFDRVRWAASGSLRGYDGSQWADLRMGAPIFDSTNVPDFSVDTGPIRQHRGDLFSELFVGRGDRQWGSLFDWYWVSSGGVVSADPLDTFPAAGDRTFVVLGAMCVGFLDDNVSDLIF